MDSDSIQFSSLPKINYAIQQNGASLITDLKITNNTSENWNDLDLEIRSEPGFCKAFVTRLNNVAAGDSFNLEKTDLMLDAEYLASLSSNLIGQLTVLVKKDEEVLAQKSVPIEVLSYDYWGGGESNWKFLASFVFPNHPEVSAIIHDASVFLGEWTGDPSLDGYQSADPERVRKQFAALFKAIQMRNITYAEPPIDFEKNGQRIRFPEIIQEEHFGTCLDTSLLFASCLEAMGLNPILVLLTSHAFVGVWLDEESFPEMIQIDCAALTKNVAEGMNRIAVVETTMVKAGENFSFINAENIAIHKLDNPASFCYAIDVFQARLNGIKPIPTRVKTPQGWMIDFQNRTDSELTGEPNELHRVIIDENIQRKEPVEAKEIYWERRLLDLSLNNPLLNMNLRRKSKLLVPLLVDHLADWEDELAAEVEFLLVSKPEDLELPIDPQGILEINFSRRNDVELLSNGRRNRRIRTILTEKDMEKTCLGLYRKARTSLEENGANTLYLALGFLRWYEKPDVDPPRYAPVIMIPVDLKRSSNPKGFSIVIRDEETQINITLLEMLRDRFHIQINNLDPLPTDDSGVDLLKIFTIIRTAILDQKGWDVLENAVLGIFSFSQFVMWNDLRSNLDQLRKSAIVSSLLDGKLCWKPELLSDGENLEEHVLAPISADSSQLVAIKAAGDGKSFVLHGPPGTGKSQTITNIITNVLAQGKRVLFVAEKMAALSVVQKRLERIGLGPYCLELHSNKSTKKDVLKQLDEAIHANGFRRPANFLDKEYELSAKRKDLLRYVNALHQQQPSGQTLFEMISRYESFHHTASELFINWKNTCEALARQRSQNFQQQNSSDRNNTTINSAQGNFEQGTGLISAEVMKRWRDLTGRIVTHLRSMTSVAEHPFRAVRKSEYTQNLRLSVLEKTSILELDITKMIQSAVDLASACKIALHENKKEYKLLFDLSLQLVELCNLPESWLRENDFPDFLTRLERFIASGKEERNNSEILKKENTQEFLDQEYQILADEWTEISKKWFIPRFFAKWRFNKKHAATLADKTLKRDWDQTLAILRTYQEFRQKRKDSLISLKVSLADFDRDDQTNWDDLESRCISAKNVFSSLQNRFREKTGSFLKIIGKNPTIKQAALDYQEKWQKFSQGYESLSSLLEIDETILFGDAEQKFDQLKKSCQNWRSSIGDLRDWVQWQMLTRELRWEGLAPIIEAVCNGENPETIITRFEKALLKEQILYAFQIFPELNVFSARNFEEKIALYKKAMGEYETLITQEVTGYLSQRIPNVSRAAAESSEMSILLKTIKNGGRSKSLRKLFTEIPYLLTRLCPCLLMSPISVAQYLEPGGEPFDLIVFDEASQMPTCKAVGALARGKNAVIVGDPKQLPPTSFFDKNSSDEENEEIADLESILDDCLVLGIPNTKLRWHYRSRHESLIAFSNRQYYDNELFTFPSVNDRISKVRLVHVPGYYDKSNTRTNRAEAEAVRDEVLRRLRDPELKKYSMGVVTFSVVQQNLVDDMITEALSQEPELEALANSGEEPFFIKNLENVQGDERDVILFSIGYGPDKSGEVSLNFGPLNRQGGWRRLNVAVSRARCEMIVFATLQPDQINLNRTRSDGVAGLKGFLEFASGKYSASDQIIEKEQTDCQGILSSITDYLAGFGYRTKSNVGRSGYRIDLGIFDPSDPENYLLGILLDGNYYKNAKTVREREYAQADVLRHLGWDLFRVWSVEWWENRDKILEQISQKIEEVKKRKKEEAQLKANLKNAALSSGNNTTNNNTPNDKTKSDKTPDEKLFVREKYFSIRDPGKGRKESESKFLTNTAGNQDSETPDAFSSVNSLDIPESIINNTDDISINVVSNFGNSDYGIPYQAMELPKVTLPKEDFYKQKNTKIIKEQISQCITGEGPISLSILTKRMMAAWGISRASTKVEDRVKNILKSCQYKKTKEGQTVFYWSDSLSAETYDKFRVPTDSSERRDFVDIPSQEIAAAICRILKDQISLSQSDLVKEVYRLFGFSRSSEKIEQKILQGIELACQKNQARKEGDRVVLLD